MRRFLPFVLFAACDGLLIGEQVGRLPTPASSSAPESPAPPASAPRPSIPCGPVGATPEPLHRLTRLQYVNIVRDVLSVDVDSGELPPDEKVGSFASNLASPVSRSTLESYTAVADRVALAFASQVDARLRCDVSAGESACADRFLATLGARLYRAPLTPEQPAAYRALFATRLDYRNGIELMVRAMLQSPHFVYRIERAPPDGEALSQHEVATRLASFLWSSAPDDELLTIAAGGGLRDPAVLRAQVDRMIQDDRARVTVQAFHLQLLGLDVDRGPSHLPAADWVSAIGQTTRFADFVIRRGDGRLASLLTGGFEVTENQRTVPLDPQRRAGLLTLPAFLAGHAHGDTSSPVRRGTAIARNLLCMTLPDPPPGVSTTVPPTSGATTRERITATTSPAQCTGCHSLVNPIGFAFEHFDPAGTWRDREEDQPIDTSGAVDAVAGLRGGFDGARDLTEKLASSAQVKECVATQWLAFARGRPAIDVEACEVAEQLVAFEASDGDLRSLLRNIATSQLFLRPSQRSAP